MNWRLIGMVGAAALLLLGCGLSENEAAGFVDQTSVNCPEGDILSIEDAAGRAELVVEARPGESFFVDYCHRAFVLDVEAVWLGELPDPVLAIIQIDPLDYVERWTDLGMGPEAVFILERDPEVPEAFRPVGDAGVIPVEGAEGGVCVRKSAFGCESESIPLSVLRELIFDATGMANHGPHPDDPNVVDKSRKPDPDLDHEDDYLEGSHYGGSRIEYMLDEGYVDVHTSDEGCPSHPAQAESEHFE